MYDSGTGVFRFPVDTLTHILDEVHQHIIRLRHTVVRPHGVLKVTDSASFRTLEEIQLVQQCEKEELGARCKCTMELQ